VDKNFNIKGFIPTSLVDWPGRIASVVFLAGCGFRCPVCHNHKLVLAPDSLDDYPLDDILQSLRRRNAWIDGVTVTGGEPTVRNDLPDLLRLIRGCGVRIKVDTNGSNPTMLVRLIESELLDAVYMDVKAPLTIRQYAKVAGVPVDPRVLMRSIRILKDSGLEVAFRTTVIPGLVEEPELESITRSLGAVHRFIVQPFRGVDTLSPDFCGKAAFDPIRFERMRNRFEVPSPAASLPTEPHAHAG
jgi:pyruvate formate lyase activating enzyme